MAKKIKQYHQIFKEVQKKNPKMAYAKQQQVASKQYQAQKPKVAAPKKPQPKPAPAGLTGIAKYNRLRSELSKYYRDKDIELKKGEFNTILQDKDTGLFQELKTQPTSFYKALDSDLLEQFVPKSPKRKTKARGKEDLDVLFPDYINHWELGEKVAEQQVLGNIPKDQQFIIDNSSLFPEVEELQDFEGSFQDYLGEGLLSANQSIINRESKVLRQGIGAERNKEVGETGYVYYVPEYINGKIKFTLMIDEYYSDEGEAKGIPPEEAAEITEAEEPPVKGKKVTKAEAEVEAVRVKSKLESKITKLQAQKTSVLEDLSSIREDIKLYKEIGDTKELKAAMKEFKSLKDKKSSISKKLDEL